MQSLFAVVPPALFSPLAAPGAPVYVQALLTLFAATQRHQQPLSRELTVSLLVDTLSSADALAVTDELESEADFVDADPLTRRASAMLRYLTRCGWLRAETQSDFTQICIFPDYAFRLLYVLQQIAANEPPRLQGLICAIHDLLQAATREGAAHIRLPEAYHQTQFLINSLKELQHNIGAHIEQVLREYQARDVLEHLFTAYRSDIVDRAYHQLRTTDHVSRFRPGVLQALASLNNDEQITAIATRLRAGGDAASLQSAASQALDQIRAIAEQFQGLDRLLQAIDVRHSQFVDSAVRSVELHLTASSTTSGQLNAIVTHLLTAPPADPASLTLADELINLFELGLVDSESLTAPARAAAPFVPAAVAPPALTPAELEAAQERTLQQLTRAVSRERVRQFAQKLLRDRPEVRGAEIALAGPEELPLLIYLRVYGEDGRLGYTVADLADAPWVERDGVGFRDFVLRRVER